MYLLWLVGYVILHSEGGSTPVKSSCQAGLKAQCATAVLVEQGCLLSLEGHAKPPPHPQRILLGA